MKQSELTPDFGEFQSLLNERQVDYLMLGGFAVIGHGYVRATGELDVWFTIDRPCQCPAGRRGDRGVLWPHDRPQRVSQADDPVGMDIPPTRIEVLTNISGVKFADYYSRRLDSIMDGVPVKIIGL